jgi:hypothetical protein
MTPRYAVVKAWREANPEAYRAIQRRYRERHPDRARQTSRESKERCKVRLAGSARPSHCEVCGAPRAVWDHDHQTGLFRGWLCARCNQTLGKVEDNPDLLLKLADYLRKRGSNGKVHVSAA